MITSTCYTPVGLRFEPEAHRYVLNDHALLHVTGCLLAAALVDRTFFTDDDRRRGSRVHRAIEQRAHSERVDDDDVAAPYLRGFDRFLADTAYRIDASEERLADPVLRVAGTLDLRGQFVDGATHDRIDVVDVKTGQTPPWVGYQLAGYVRLLPIEVRNRCRRWSLTLRHDGSYRLTPHAKQSDERVFGAAVTIAAAKRGWL